MMRVIGSLSRAGRKSTGYEITLRGAKRKKHRFLKCRGIDVSGERLAANEHVYLAVGWIRHHLNASCGRMRLVLIFGPIYSHPRQECSRQAGCRHDTRATTEHSSLRLQP